MVTLPNRDDMMARLTAACDDENLRQRLYPLLQRNAGKTLAPQGVVLKLFMAINEFAAGSTALVNATCLYAPEFINALAEDTDSANEVRTLWQDMLAHAAGQTGKK